jgi:hypothetical protein
LTATAFADKFPVVANLPLKNQTPGDERRGDLSDFATRWNSFLIQPDHLKLARPGGPTLCQATAFDLTLVVAAGRKRHGRQ